MHFWLTIVILVGAGCILAGAKLNLFSLYRDPNVVEKLGPTLWRIGVAIVLAGSISKLILTVAA